MATTFDTVYTAYHSAIDAISGYTPNSKINDETFSPRATAHKQFFLELTEGEPVDDGMGSGKIETRSLSFAAKVLYQYPAANTYAANEAATLSLINAVIKALYAVTFTGYIQIEIGRFQLSPLSNGFKLCTLQFRAMFSWSII